MKLSSDTLKELSRKLRGVGGELFNFNGLQANSSVPNLDIFVEFKTDKPFAVDAEKFSQVVSRLDGEVDFTITESKCVLKTKRSKLSLPISEARPAICPKHEKLITVQHDKLMPALNYALQATMRGSFFSYNGAIALGKHAAGSDGKRLAFAEFDGGLPEQIILPVPAVEALKAFSGPAIQIGQNEQNIYFHDGDTALVARRLVKAFPDYEKLIPASTKYNFSFDTNELKNALKSLKPIIAENGRICLTLTDDSCMISAASESGDGDVQIAAQGGDAFLEFRCELTYEYLADFCESVRGPAILLGANSEKGPFLLESGKFKLIIAGSR